MENVIDQLIGGLLRITPLVGFERLDRAPVAGLGASIGRLPEGTGRGKGKPRVDA